VSLSAAPAFDASQCNTFSLALGATAVTSSSLANGKAGQFLTFIISQDGIGNRSFAWPSNLLHACAISSTPNAATMVTAIHDGVNANALDCTTTDAATVISGPERSEVIATAAGQGALTFSSAAHTPVYFGNAGSARHAIPRMASGDQMQFSDLGGAAAPSQLPPPGASTIGAVQSKTCAAGQHVSAINTDGTVTCSNDNGSGGGSADTVASGQTALPTAALAANSCSAASITAAAGGAASTDAIEIAYASDPTGITGYGAGTNGGISIRFWLTANTFNLKLCNETGSSITPGPLSLNWRVVR
jgi:hypothetical protein